MRVARTVLGGLVLLLTSGALCTDSLSATAGRADNWERVKLAVARNSVLVNAPRFFQSLGLWAGEARAHAQEALVQIDTDATESLSVDEKRVVHIKGDLR